MKEISETWGDDSQYYEKAAVKFADEFEHWGGFSAEKDAANLAYFDRQWATNYMVVDCYDGILS
jgi:hypothetical protein